MPSGSERLAAAERDVQAAFSMAEARATALKASITIAATWSGASAGELITRAAQMAGLGSVVEQAKQIAQLLRADIAKALGSIAEVEQDGVRLQTVAKFLRGEAADLPLDLDMTVAAAAHTLRGSPAAPACARSIDIAIATNVAEARRLLGDAYAERTRVAGALVGAKHLAEIATKAGDQRTASIAAKLRNRYQDQHDQRWATGRRRKQIEHAT